MKLGIVGSGNIVVDALNALEQINEIEISAICGRIGSVEKLRKLSTQYEIPKYYTDYDEFLKDEEVEIVYLGIINSLHFSYAKKALETGKNVICEKPFTSNYKEIKILSDLAKDKNLFLFEAITMLYSPNFNYVKKNLQLVGDVKLVQCNYSQYSSRYDKYLEGVVLPAFDLNLSGGALYDINIYNVHFVVGLFGRPIAVKYIANIGFNGIDTSGVLLLFYEGFTAVCCGAKDSSSVNHATVQGNKGYLKINSSVNVSESVDVMLNKELSTYNKETYSNRMVNEFSAFEKMLKENDLQKCYQYLEHSEIVMEVVYQARKDANIVFPSDSSY